ncbi:hypothetical protein FGB62_32g132 [Gracilaria domingensis]|nr:hypothetical protein FGB62_32g132 [Gracilaria domingensis]
MPQRNARRSKNPSTKRARQTKSSSAQRTQQASSHSETQPADSLVSEPSQEEMPSKVCSVCAEEAVDWAVGHCPHVVCGNCFHRMRVLYDRKTCVMCNDAIKQVAVVPLNLYSESMTFDAAVALPGAFHDKKVDMWFLDRNRYQQLRTVRGWKCSHRSCAQKDPQQSTFHNAEQLRAHVRSVHRCVYCNICFSGRKSFVSELQLYPLDKDRNHSSRQRAHMRKEHSTCKFCRKYFLDDDALYSHLQETHETCTLCERNGRMHEYYVNFEQLERHYEQEHYVCQQDSCRGVVFPTNIALQAHIHTRHGEASRGTRARALRVNLADLHQEDEPRRSAMHSQSDVQRERELQAARRRAFLSSNVVFSGALNLDDTTLDSVPDVEDDAPASSLNTPLNVQSSASTSAQEARDSATRNHHSTDENVDAQTRRPDDGRFHPLSFPRDGEERQARNTLLVRTMRSLLEPGEYEDFRTTSADFQSGKKSAEEYYDAVVDCFGVRAAVRDILPELVALLPNPLLREPLLQICLRRTNTPGNEAGYLHPNGPNSSSQQTSNGRAEQFPTLSDAPPPRRRKTPKTQRFGTLGPEEFPRLGRVNRVGQAAEPNASEASSSSAPRSTPSVARSNRPPEQRKTAATILREAPPTSALRGLRVTGAPAPSVRPSPLSVAPSARPSPLSVAPSVRPSPASTDAFPSLPSASASAAVPPRPSQRQGSNTSAQRRSAVSSFTDFPALGAPTNSVSEESQANDAAAQPTEDSAPSADVSMRVGAVWGGAASNGRGGKRRGPGNRRRPATPPKSVVLSSSNIPDFRATSGLDRGAASQPSQSQENEDGKRNKVIDVAQIAKARREALRNSSVPKVGSSGYGFAWERKKAQQKKKEIKSSMNLNG